ncbi:hypothetical protein KCP75_13465 [Salmonella enterica subsp. enterica]|nr:hypothetical protein KCP75_13465 [Salmonella enterica subsp. enterica]
MAKVPETVPEDERSLFTLAACQAGLCAHARCQIVDGKTKGNPIRTM